ncbi:Aste57867_25549 [Aphanomyces stellatus]|uniref:Aste57867_25549 protein n=1 Tax=Aphanomyces stellatus TaxID=120398 RepID=A0A485LTL2_9STRA|nr:hypothetical protein As57867_025470 [Aphanomyces stellatus]VFU02172.1 Aste57867_25549 [Aphanomyces stellatus]
MAESTRRREQLRDAHSHTLSADEKLLVAHGMFVRKLVEGLERNVKSSSGVYKQRVRLSVDRHLTAMTWQPLKSRFNVFFAPKPTAIAMGAMRSIARWCDEALSVTTHASPPAVVITYTSPCDDSCGGPSDQLTIFCASDAEAAQFIASFTCLMPRQQRGKLEPRGSFTNQPKENTMVVNKIDDDIANHDGMHANNDTLPG